jgi:hypothetical protein
MNDVKNKNMSLATTLIVLAIYNVVVFVIPFPKGGNFWAGYGFTMLAMLLTVAVGFYALNREGLKSKVYGVPLVSVAWRYLVTQIIVGAVEMCLQFIPYKIPFQYGIALNTILLGCCLLGLIAVDTGKKIIEQIDEKIKEKVFYIKSLQVDVEGLADKAPDESTKKSLKDLAETIRYCDPMSSPQLATVENKIEAKVGECLANAVERKDNGAIKAACEELQLLLAERNRKCKILK